MLILKLAGKTTRTNVASSIVDTLQRRQLLQNHLSVDLAMVKSKKLLQGEMQC